MMSMLPENQEKLENEADMVKFTVGKILDYAHEGNHASARGLIYHLMSVELPYLMYVLDKDEAGRVAEGIHEWITNLDEREKARMRFNR